jgi:hypothetical protein
MPNYTRSAKKSTGTKVNSPKQRHQRNLTTGAAATRIYPKNISYR